MVAHQVGVEAVGRDVHRVHGLASRTLAGVARREQGVDGRQARVELARETTDEVVEALHAETLDPRQCAGGRFRCGAGRVGSSSGGSTSGGTTIGRSLRPAR